MRNLLEETRLKKQKNQLTLIDIWGRVSMAYVDCVFIFLMMPGLMGYKHTFTRQLAMSVERRWRINGDEENNYLHVYITPPKQFGCPFYFCTCSASPFSEDSTAMMHPFGIPSKTLPSPTRCSTVTASACPSLRYNNILELDGRVTALLFNFGFCCLLAGSIDRITAFFSFFIFLIYGFHINQM